MKVHLDQRLCAVHGECVLEAPEVFDLDDDDDVAIVLLENPPEAMRAQVERAVSACPVAAITIED